MLLDVLKRLDANTVPLDDLLEAAALGKLVIAEYHTRQLDSPTWLEPKLRLLELAIESKAAEQRDKRIRELRRELQGTLSVEERRQKIEDELARLGAPVKTKAPEPTPTPA